MIEQPFLGAVCIYPHLRKIKRPAATADVITAASIPMREEMTRARLLTTSHREREQLAGLDVAEDRRERQHHHRDMTTDQVADRLTIALIELLVSGTIATISERSSKSVLLVSLSPIQWR